MKSERRRIKPDSTAKNEMYDSLLFLRCTEVDLAKSEPRNTLCFYLPRSLLPWLPTCAPSMVSVEARMKRKRWKRSLTSRRSVRILKRSTTQPSIQWQRFCSIAQYYAIDQNPMQQKANRGVQRIVVVQWQKSDTEQYQWQHKHNRRGPQSTAERSRAQ